ncbi:hypothetical protein BGZ94_008807 [Podila epigama]|nr:hypothetical protein BGZ94_008807 [Podila epigama]
MELTPAHLAAIREDASLVKAVQEMIASHPDTTPIVARLLTFMQDKITKATTDRTKSGNTPQQGGIAQFFSKPALSASSSKNITSSNTTGGNNNSNNSHEKTISSTPQDALGPAIYATTPLSFLHPVRKKLVLTFTATEMALVSPSATTVADIVVRAPYSAIRRIIAVPFLERATKHTAVLIFFRHKDISSSKDALWAVPLSDDGKDFALTLDTKHQQLAGLASDLTKPDSNLELPIPITNYKRPDQLLVATLAYFLHRTVGPVEYAKVDIIPTPPASSPYQNFSAHLKSNQGTMYLLPSGLLFAFRKPVLFLPGSCIEAVGVHSVLSRTFDFEVVVDTNVATAEDLEGVPPEGKDGRRCVGFGMVDTKVFGKFEDWIKKQGIRDRSLSEDLKAKDKSTSASGSSSKKRDRAADDEDGEGDGEEDRGSDGSQRKKKTLGESSQGAGGGAAAYDDDDDDDDDEDDQDFAPESDDEIMEEYDSDAVGSDSDNDDEEGPAKKQGQKTRSDDVDDEEDLEEESLGEDEDEEEDEMEGDDDEDIDELDDE